MRRRREEVIGLVPRRLAHLEPERLDERGQKIELLEDRAAPTTFRSIDGTGNNTAIALRGIGPSLTQAGITDALPDPTLELHDGNGATLIANDNWQDDPAQSAFPHPTSARLSASDRPP